MTMVGRTLGNFELVTLIGRGGMGEVYQAKDRKLGRDVAIKVLPEEFARDFDRVSRFQREAKLLASLNHPNIAAIYGLEESGGTNFLVLELVPGETLSDQLKRGPIPIEETLKLALQMAEALESAHEKGVIHRDLKPANIKVTPEGKVKVLDFGLAKAFAGEQADLNLSNSPTLSNLATQQGVILGTAAYMPPEQARGKAVDKRADIWAFGCVLYEMLTGRQTWTGATVTDILAAALAKEPDFSLLPANIHPRIREVLARCLQKDPTERLRDVGDVRVEIKHILADPTGVLVQPVAASKPRKKLRLGLPWVAAAVVFSIIVTGAAIWKLKPAEPRQITRFSYEPPKEQQLANVTERAIAISHDGRQFVYSTSEGIYLRSMADMDARLLPGTGGILQRPFFSPDDKWIGFYSSTDSKLKKIAISGGAPVTLADVQISGSFDWNADDTIVYGQWGRGIRRVSANGGNPESIVAGKNETILHPQILPDGKSILFSRVQPTPFRIMVQSLKSGERKELLEGSVARYLPTGHIVYEFGSTLFALRFDLNALKLVGGPVSLVDGVLRAGGAPQFAVSDSGTLVYIPGTTTAGIPSMRALVWVDRNGKEEPVAVESKNHNAARMSPDGTKVALQFSTDGNGDIWIEDLLRKAMMRLTFDPTMDGLPLWTLDGKRIVFGSNREGSGVKIFWKAADNTGKEEIVGSLSGGDMIPGTWSRDGKTLVVMERPNQAEIRGDIGTLSMEGDHKHRVLLKEKYSHLQPQVSHNGRWIAYTSDESGQTQIYVRPFPEVDTGHWQVSTNGGDSPLWSHDDRELFYHNGDAIMAVPVKTETTFSLETPKLLFRGTYVFPNLSAIAQSINLLYPWDISHDGKRFLMIKPPGASTSAEGGPRIINVVLNWFEDLKQRVPVK